MMEENKDNDNFLQELPRFIIYKILSQLDIVSLTNFSLCSQTLKQYSEINVLWKNIYYKYYSMDSFCLRCSKFLIEKYDSKSTGDTIMCSNKVLIKKICQEEHLKYKFWTNVTSTDMKFKTLDQVGIITKMCFYDSNIFVYTGIIPRIYLFSFDLERTIVKFKSPHPRFLINFFILETISFMIMTDHGLVCASLDGLITIWHITHNYQKCSIAFETVYHHKKAIHTLSFDNSILVSGSDDFTACIFNLENLNLIDTIVYPSAVRCSAINDKWILISGVHKSIVLMDRQFRQIATLFSHTSSVVQISLNAKFNLPIIFFSKIVSISRDNTIKIWDLENIVLKYTMNTQIYVHLSLNRVKFLSEDAVLINDFVKGIHLICLKNYHCLHIFKNSFSKILNFITIDKYMITSNKKKEISIWDLKKLVKIKTFSQMNKISENYDNIKLLIRNKKMVAVLDSRNF
ncbi:hypothetical protein HZS_243, partial [Henneguya salminicola]